MQHLFHIASFVIPSAKRVIFSGTQFPLFSAARCTFAKDVPKPFPASSFAAEISYYLGMRCKIQVKDELQTLADWILEDDVEDLLNHHLLMLPYSLCSCPAADG